MKRLILVFALLLCLPAATQVSGNRAWRPLEFVPPSIYTVLWGWSEECSGIERDMSDVTWILAEFILAANGNRLAGQYAYPQRVITLDWRMWDDARTVVHEMLHDMFRDEVLDESPVFQSCIDEVVNKLGG